MTDSALEPGALVHVRQRRWIVEGVTNPPDPRDSPLVELACVDDDAQGQPLTILWDCEPDARVLAEDVWGEIGKHGFDRPEIFAAYLNTRRWNCVTSTDPTLFQAPFRAGIKIDAYQLEPLRKALALPRVNIFIADDVGLGKTIEAGLIARELLLRRRLETILVVAPPTMVPQWREEMESRFGLTFAVIDRAYLTACRRERGFGINPWTTHSRFLISNRLLIDETYVAGLRDWLGELKPKSLLILDEAHHAAPASGAKFAIDSQITRAVRELSHRFEHRLFLSATPHNGHSNSFSALLEILDPNRFCRGVKVRPRDLDAVMVRRLKDDIRKLEGGFPERKVEQIDIDGLPAGAPELVLAAKLDAYRELRETRLAKDSPSVQRRARLVIVTLQQRLLSSIEAFARTIGVHRQSMLRAAAEPLESRGRSHSRRAPPVLEAPDANDDRAELDPELLVSEDNAAIAAATEDALSEADEKLGLGAELKALAELEELAQQYRDLDDARMRSLLKWIDQHQCPGALKADGGTPTWTRRKIIIFTEWEDTRRYIERRLRGALAHTDQAEERIATFTGPTSQDRREELKHAFNADPDENPIRILIATDAAREGLNLQRHCYDLFHFDLPWNPSRLEQRNGRIDRKLQPNPTVYCRYFFYRQRPEDRVLRTLVRKTETIRRELGALAEVLEARAADHMAEGIRRRDIARLERAIENTGDDSATLTVREELDAAEQREERLKRVREEIGQLQNYLARSRKRAGVQEDQIHHAIDVGLKLSGGSALAPSMPAADKHPALFDLKIEGTPIANDQTWLPALDALRAWRRKSEGLAEWRRRAPIRPVAFSDPGEIGERAVQLHLENRIVQRVLGRFVSKGRVEYDLSRACLGVAPDAIPRVALIARLSLFGTGGARLHDELVEVTARWIDPADRKPTLRPYGEDAAQRTLELLDETLAKTPKAVPDVVLRRIAASLRRDVEELTPQLEARVTEVRKRAEKALIERGEREARSMRELLADQERRIRETIAKHDTLQLSLDLGDIDRRQAEADRKYRQKRLTRLAQDQESEPGGIIEGYVVRAHRIEPVGIAYLWPVTG